MVLFGNHLVAWASRTFTATETAAFIDGLVNATEQVVFVVRTFAVVVVGRGTVGVLGRSRLHNHLAVSQLVNHLALLHSLSPNPLHLCFRDRRTGYLLNGVDSNESLSFNQMEIAGGVEFCVRDVGVFLLNEWRCTSCCISRVLRRL